jgi:GNAT superfamily N-acetyltransferase
MRPLLRSATPDDSEFVFRVKKAALGEYVRRTWGWDETFQRDLHAKEYDPRAIRIISHLDTDVGWLEVERRSDELYLAGIYVLPEYQGGGVGSALIMEIMKEASDWHIPVALQVLKVNPRAQALYERLGFAVTGESETSYLMSWSPGR